MYLTVPSRLLHGVRPDRGPSGCPASQGATSRQWHETGGPTTDHLLEGAGPPVSSVQLAREQRRAPGAAAVADDLSDRLALAWVVDTDVAHDLVPDAHVDVVWLPDGGVQVCGPEVEGWTFRPL